MYAQIEGNKVKLYGTIYSGDGQWVVNDTSKLFASSGDVAVHLHTNGGSVFDGNLIFNAINKAKANITVYVDGLAASMGAIIMLAAKKIIMSENAFVMVHAPSGTVTGNAKALENNAKLMRGMEANFLKKLVARTGKTEIEVKEWLDGDNWFSATEALEALLIDETTDSIFEESDLTAYQDMNLCASLFDALGKKPETSAEAPKAEMPEAPQSPKQVINPQTNKQMKLTAESIVALGLKPEASETDVNAAIANQTARVRELEAKATADHEAKVTALIDGAVASGKFLASEKEAWKKDAESNYELTARMIGKMEGKTNLSDKVVNGKSTASAREAWTLTDWRKKDLEGLIAMKSAEPEAYAELRLNK